MKTSSGVFKNCMGVISKDEKHLETYKKFPEDDGCYHQR
jgi:hypothetical protein